MLEEFEAPLLVAAREEARQGSEGYNVHFLGLRSAGYPELYRGFSDGVRDLIKADPDSVEEIIRRALNVIEMVKKAGSRTFDEIVRRDFLRHLLASFSEKRLAEIPDKILNGLQGTEALSTLVLHNIKDVLSGTEVLDG